MSISKAAFYTDLYTECQIEIGSLLDDRMAYFSDQQISWIDVRELEERIDAYLDVLEIGGEPASLCMFELLEAGDEDDLLGSLFQFSSINYKSVNPEKIANMFDTLADNAPILLNAFKYGRNANLTEMLLPYLQHKSALVRSIVAEILGYRGDADPHRIWPLFHDKDENVKVAALVAVMRLGFKKSVPAMEQAVLENKSMFNEHCVFPLLMLGSQKALKFSRLACQSADYVKPQYPIYLALGGNESDFSPIVNSMKFDGMNAAVLEALGILGSLKGVKILMQFLDSANDEEKLAAAKSLNQISGAQLYENVEFIEKAEDDIAVEDITGKPAASSEDKQASDERVIEVKQDCADKQRWTEWWQQNRQRFDASVRYRHGKPYSFFLCLQEIAHPQTNYEDRHRAYNELVIRSGHHIPFEPDWFIDKQIDSLKQWQSWWNKNKSTFPNQWMFNGS